MSGQPGLLQAGLPALFRWGQHWRKRTGKLPPMWHASTKLTVRFGGFPGLGNLRMTFDYRRLSPFFIVLVRKLGIG
jgi:hypothetical protein